MWVTAWRVPIAALCMRQSHDTPPAVFLSFPSAFDTRICSNTTILTPCLSAFEVYICSRTLTFPCRLHLQVHACPPRAAKPLLIFTVRLLSLLSYSTILLAHMALDDAHLFIGRSKHLEGSYPGSPHDLLPTRTSCLYFHHASRSEPNSCDDCVTRLQ
jgi:hypothetical protein